jgi:hypothetical protein
MPLTKGVVLGLHISLVEMKADPAKIEVISNLPTPKTQKNVCRFLRHTN